MLNFTVKNQSISRTDTFRPVANSRDYLRCAFSFSDDWTGLLKTALFKSQSGAVYSVPLDSDGACVVPNEILSGNPRKHFSVSVYGKSPEGTPHPVFLPADSITVFLETSGYWQH